MIGWVRDGGRERGKEEDGVEELEAERCPAYVANRTMASSSWGSARASVWGALPALRASSLLEGRGGTAPVDAAELCELRHCTTVPSASSGRREERRAQPWLGCAGPSAAAALFLRAARAQGAP
jgi:hypothetical protein